MSLSCISENLERDKENVLAAVSRGNDGLDDGLECAWISTQTDHLEMERVFPKFLEVF